MADSDYDSHDDYDDRRRDDRRRDDYDDRRRDDGDRPRRRYRDDAPPKKKGGGLLIVLAILGVVGLVCVGGCGGMIWWGVDVYNKMTGTAEDFLVKVGSGDYSGAYNSTTPAYKARRTLAQFTADMKAAKLDKYQTKSFVPTGSQTVGNTHRLSGAAGLTDGGSVNITVVIEQAAGAVQFTVDDVTATGIGSTTTTPSSTTPSTNNDNDNDNDK